MTEEQIDKMLERLKEINVELDPDPLGQGPAVLQNKVALVRNYTTEVQGYVRSVQLYFRQVELGLQYAKSDYELQFNDLMATDQEILNMRNLSQADRKAVANTRLRDEMEEINRLELELTSTKHLLTVVQDKQNELKGVMSAIRIQRDLIKSEIETGSFWGTEDAASDHEDPTKPQKVSSQKKVSESLSRQAAETEKQAFDVEEDEIDVETLFGMSDRDAIKKPMAQRNQVLTLKETTTNLPGTVVRDLDNADIFGPTSSDADYMQALENLN